MKTLTGGPGRRFSAARLALCFILIAVAIFRRPTPAQAAGPYTHTEFVARAKEELKKLDQADPYGDYSKLVSILEGNGGIVNYGALFPDVAMRTNADWGEFVHDTADLRQTYRPGVDPLQQRHRPVPPFRAALIAQMQDHIQRSPRTGEDEKMIAFLFGLIAHQEADIPWHLCPNYDESCKPVGLEAAAARSRLRGLDYSQASFQVEAGYDVLLYTDQFDWFKNDDRTHKVAFGFFTNHLKDDIRAASPSAPRPNREMVCLWGDVCVCVPFMPGACAYRDVDPLDKGEWDVEAAWAFVTTDLGGDIDAADKSWLESYSPGGLDNGAKLIAVAWKETWDLLTGRPEVASATISGATKVGPGRYTFAAAFEPAGAIPPLDWEWDNGDTTSTTTRALTEGTHTLQATAKGLEGKPLATASATIVIGPDGQLARMWSISGALDVAINPATESSIEFSYKAPTPYNYTYRKAAFMTVATRTGTIAFDWEYYFFHSWYKVYADLWVYADGPSGRTVQRLVEFYNWGGTGPKTLTGSASLNVIEGYEFGLEVGGSNYDYSQILEGKVTLTNFGYGP